MPIIVLITSLTIRTSLPCGLWSTGSSSLWLYFAGMETGDEASTKAYLLIGGNLGDRMQNLAEARKMINNQAGEIIKASSLYETAAWGIVDQPDFLNQALVINTTKGPLDLLDSLLSIERELGRMRNEKFGPRTVDIDILFYGNHIIDHPDLVIPHPRMAQRRFVLEPLCELAPDFMHPIKAISVKKMLENCTDTLNVKKIG